MSSISKYGTPRSMWPGDIVAELRRRLGKSLFWTALLLAALKVVFWDIDNAAGEHVSNAQVLVMFLLNAWIIGLFFAIVWLTGILAREQVITKTWLQRSNSQ